RRAESPVNWRFSANTQQSGNHQVSLQTSGFWKIDWYGDWGQVTDAVLLEAGKALYRWADLESGNISTLRIRERVTESYVLRGGFHILANTRPLPRIYWHPRFLNRVGELLGASQ
nr:hypothetical protein [Rhodoferax sp.]